MELTGTRIDTPVTLNLVTGLNGVGFPKTSEPYTAPTLAAAIEAQGGDIKNIYQWREDLGIWEAHPVGFPINDFPVALGRGYFLSVTAGVTFEVTGPSVSSPLTLNLVTGLNGVGFPATSGAYTASSLAQEIANQGGLVNNIYRWREDLGIWEAHPVGIPINDFDIENGRGYMIQATIPTAFSP